MPVAVRMIGVDQSSLVTEFDLEDFHPEPGNVNQYLHEYNQNGSDEPSRELWKAVLDQALRDYQTFEKEDKFQEIFDWFFNSSSERAGSFRFICDHLDINSNYVLKRLIIWSKENL